MRIHARLLLIAGALSVVGACGTPSLGARVSPAPPPAGVELTVETAKPAGANSNLAILASPDLREFDWEQVVVPSNFCGIGEPTALVNGGATATSTTWGPVQLAFRDVEYGDLLGDEKDEAAVSVYCDNGGGTGSGLLEYGIAIFAEREGSLTHISTVTATKQFEGIMPTSVSVKEWKKPSMVVSEYYYREYDPTCCPSGEAETTWTWAGETLAPGASRVLK
jgi:hypothetical protein